MWGDFVSLGGAASLGVSAILYLISIREGRKAEQLHGARALGSIEEVAGLVLPLLVSVRGRVDARTPRKCELSDMSTVLHEVVEEEIYRKERDNGRMVQEPFEVRRVFAETEWFLEDGARHTLKVENASQASRLSTCLETKQVFTPEDPSKSTMMKLLFEKAVRSMVKYGTRKTERFLPVGAVVTVVGEVAPNQLRVPAAASSSSTGPSTSSAQGPAGGGSWLNSGSGSGSTVSSNSVVTSNRGGLAASLSMSRDSAEPPAYVLRRPVHGPFYITSQTVSQLHASLANSSRIYKYLSLGFGVLGVALIASKAVRRLWRAHRERQVAARLAQAEAVRKQRHAERQRQAEALAGQPGSAQSETGAQPTASAGVNGASQQQACASGRPTPPADVHDRAPNTCVICMDQDCEVVFGSCGHLCCCYGCGGQLAKCPICRTSGKPIRVYRP